MENTTDMSTAETPPYDFLEYSNVTNFSHAMMSTTTPLLSMSNATSVGLSKNIIIPSAMFFIGVFGNVVALIILSVRPSKVSRSTAFYHLVKALAVIDLMGIVALSPATIAVYIKGGLLKTGGMALCHYFSVGLLMAGTSTLFVVLVMAAERLLVTKYPFHYGEIVTHARVNIAIAVILIVSLLGALLPVVGLGHNIDPWPHTWCFFDYRSTDVGAYIYSAAYAVVGFVVLIVTIILNSIVILHLWRMRRSRLITNSVRSTIPPVSSQSSKQIDNPDSEKRMVIFLMAITFVFTICYTPLMVRVVMNQFWNAGRDLMSGGVDDVMDLWALRMASLNQLIDPWVYIISRFTCCSGPRERSQSRAITSSPSTNARAGNSVRANQVTNSNPTATARFGKSLRTIRKMFSSSKNGINCNSDNAMAPLRTECFTSQRSSSPTTTTTITTTPPIYRNVDRPIVIENSKGTESEMLCNDANNYNIV